MRVRSLFRVSIELRLEQKKTHSPDAGGGRLDSEFVEIERRGYPLNSRPHMPALQRQAIQQALRQLRHSVWVAKVTGLRVRDGSGFVNAGVSAVCGVGGI